MRREMIRTAVLAAPLVGGQLASVGLNFTDTLMAGRLGGRTLASVAVGNSSSVAFVLFATGVMMAVQASIAHLEGAGRQREMPRYLGQAAWVAIGLSAVGVVVFRCFEPILRFLRVQPELIPEALSYLRMLAWGLPGMTLYLALRFFSEGVGHTRPTLGIGILGLAVNVPANAILMFGWGPIEGRGATGCAIATSLVWWSQCVAMAIYLRRSVRYRERRLFAELGRPRLREIWEILRIGLPIGTAIFLEASMFAAAALLVGSIGTDEMAGHQVAINFASVVFMIPLGIAMATTVRVGQADGRGDRSGVVRVAFAGFLLTLGCQLVSAATMVGLPNGIVRLYTDDPAVIAIAVHLLWFAALFQLSDGLQVSAAGALRGLRDTRVPMLMTLVAYWGVGLPVGYLLAIERGQGPAGLWIGLIAGLTVAAVLLGGRFFQLVRGG